MFISFFSSINATIKPCLNQLNTDTDIDVKFFASEAMLGEENCVYYHLQNVFYLYSFKEHKAFIWYIGIKKYQDQTKSTESLIYFSKFIFLQGNKEQYKNILGLRFINIILFFKFLEC